MFRSDLAAVVTANYLLATTVAELGVSRFDGENGLA